MFIKVSSSRNHKEPLNATAYVVSQEPLYLAVIIKPQPGIWDELMDQDVMFIRDSSGMDVESNIKQRIEVGENSIFFVTSQDERFRKICGEISR
ncbi:MAG: hypothetical protein ACYCSO_00960 [Cuniculiplasma sp.]